MQEHNPPVWRERGDCQPGSQGLGDDGSNSLWPYRWHLAAGEAASKSKQPSNILWWFNIKRKANLNALEVNPVFLLYQLINWMTECCWFVVHFVIVVIFIWLHQGLILLLLFLRSQSLLQEVAYGVMGRIRLTARSRIRGTWKFSLISLKKWSVNSFCKSTFYTFTTSVS